MYRCRRWRRKQDTSLSWSSKDAGADVCGFVLNSVIAAACLAWLIDHATLLVILAPSPVWNPMYDQRQACRLTCLVDGRAASSLRVGLGVLSVHKVRPSDVGDPDGEVVSWPAAACAGIMAKSIVVLSPDRVGHPLTYVLRSGHAHRGRPSTISTATRSVRHSI